MNNFNAITKQPYSSINQDALEEHKEYIEVESDEWAGFQQWKQAGRQVVKGATACKILMVCEKKETSKNGEEKKRKVLKALHVFNREQTKEI